MSDSVSAISTSSVSSSSSSSTALKQATKEKLEKLGIDTSNITTEAEGQTKLQEAQAAQAAQQSQTQQSQQNQQSSGSSSMSTIQEEAKSLASTLGVKVGTNDSIDTIFSNLSDKISSLQSSAGTDASKKSEASRYQEEYTQIYDEYTAAKSSQDMLSNSLSAMANYNKASLSLS